VQIENILVPSTYLAIQARPWSGNVFHIRLSAEGRVNAYLVVDIKKKVSQLHETSPVYYSSVIDLFNPNAP
jgi:hypothetical protein